MKKLLLILLLFTSAILAQTPDDLIVTGDRLVGKTINGQRVREVIGNVVITQKDMVITCLKADQYLDLNKIVLYGDVVATQDTIVLKTEKGFYDGNVRYAWSDTAIFMNDSHMTLKADSGNYNFDTKYARFYNNVELVDSVNTLNCDKLNYDYSINKSVSVGNVSIQDTTGTIYCDSLHHFRDTGLAYAYRNVKIKGLKKNALILGKELENDTRRKYSKITGQPMLMQIDTTKSGKIDTLLVISEVMESYSDSVQKLIVTDSVRILRGAFAAVTDNATLFRETNNIHTSRKDEESLPPVMWYNTSQLVGDSVKIFLENRALNKINIVQDAFILTRNELFDFRYDQISGKIIDMYFSEGQLNKTFVNGNVLSIYYMYDDGEQNGLIKSSANEAKIYFDSSKVADVRMYGKPVTEFHPESLVKGSERDFTLPQFVIYTNKPDKDAILEMFEKRKLKSGR